MSLFFLHQLPWQKVLCVGWVTNQAIFHSLNEMDWTYTFWNMAKFIRRGLTFLEEFITCVCWKVFWNNHAILYLSLKWIILQVVQYILLQLVGNQVFYYNVHVTAKFPWKYDILQYFVVNFTGKAVQFCKLSYKLLYPEMLATSCQVFYH